MHENGKPLAAAGWFGRAGRLLVVIPGHLHQVLGQFPEAKQYRASQAVIES
jgi:hypothetical protein